MIGATSENPVTSFALCLFPAVFTTLSAVDGIIYGFFPAYCICASCAVVSVLKRYIPEKFRLCFNILLTVIITGASALLMSGLTKNENQLPELTSAASALVYVLAFSSAGKPQTDIDSRTEITVPLISAPGIILTFFACGIVRELLGSGTLFGGRLISASIFGEQLDKTGGMLHPAGGLILLGFVGALLNLLGASVKHKEAAKTISEEEYASADEAVELAESGTEGDGAAQNDCSEPDSAEEQQADGTTDEES